MHFRRSVLGLVASLVWFFSPLGSVLFSMESPSSADARANLAVAARVSASYHSGDTTPEALNDGAVPVSSRDNSRRTYGNWPRTGTEWVEYAWPLPVTTREIAIYWWADGQGVGLPKSYRLLQWNGSAFVPVTGVSGYAVVKDGFTRVTFDPVRTERLRLEIVSDGRLSTGLIEWTVFDAGGSPNFPPVVNAGPDRSVVRGGRTYLTADVKTVSPSGSAALVWRKVSGPGKITFSNVQSAATTASFAKTGDYQLELVARAGDLENRSTVSVRVVEPPPAERLDVVYTKRYRIDSPLWDSRAKALIVNWIPHCIAQINRSDLREGQGGIDNFVEAAKALRGETHAPHKGYVFSNAWVHQTVESICIALMVDPKGDQEIIAAQAAMRATLEDWIPKILAAQEPDGYLHTPYTLANRAAWPERWDPAHRADHEGYTAGYFIESAINHYTLTEGRDLRLYDAAKKLADCWVANLGPGKKAWWDGHQEMEQALVRFCRFVNDMEGGGRGDAYIELAKFLLDCRSDGEEYDQSHVPVIRQYTAVGHAVRATYGYSAMADIAAETGDIDYESAVQSLWDNLINRKYYVTGGIGSGETSEGFGPDFSLPHNAYCESCSSAGLIFFHYKLNLAYHDAKYADLYEETLYNALLGSVDLPAKNFTYTNPLVGGRRGPWHPCPCCVGNIPRTLLMIPTWTYVKGPKEIYTNLFIGGSTLVEKVAGTDVEMVQRTNYPADGAVSITVNPKESRRFTVYVRVPDRKTSALYSATPEVSGLLSFAVNGRPEKPRIEKGYAAVTRRWRAGDRIDLVLPMDPQRVVSAEPRVAANRGLVALRRGPLIYSVERADQADLSRALGTAPLRAEWRPDFLGGVTTLAGEWADGAPLLAIPYYARLNRSGQVAAPVAEPAVNYAPGATNAVSSPVPAAPAPPPAPARSTGPESSVWLKAQP
jgi:DUF1680 family protein